MKNTNNVNKFKLNRVFISYRRDGGFEMARLVRDHLQSQGYSVFMDVEDLRSGPFNTALLKEIDSATDVILILSPGSLDRCVNEDDWLRLEVAHAIKCGLNIIPVMTRGFQWPRETLPEDLTGLPHYNGITPSNEYFQASLDRLTALLNAEALHQSGSVLRKCRKVVVAFITLLVVLVAVFFGGRERFFAKPDPAVQIIVGDITRNLAKLDQREQIFIEDLLPSSLVNMKDITDPDGYKNQMGMRQDLLNSLSFSQVMNEKLNEPLTVSGIDPGLVREFYDALTAYDIQIKDYFANLEIIRKSPDPEQVKRLQHQLSISTDMVRVQADIAYLIGQKILTKAPHTLLVETQKAMMGFTRLKPKRLMTESEIDAQEKILEAQENEQLLKLTEIVAKDEANSNKLKDEYDRTQRAVQLVVTDVLTNISHLDAQMNYVEGMRNNFKETETFRSKWEYAKKKTGVATSLPIIRPDYSSVIALLRQQFNSHPLPRGMNPLLTPAIQESCLNREIIQAFYRRLINVDQTAQSLFTSLIEWSHEEKSDNIAFKKKEVLLNADRFDNCCQSAYLAGQKALLLVSPDLLGNANQTLSGLKQLQPAKMLTTEEYLSRSKENLAQMKELVSRREKLKKELEDRTAQLLKKMVDLGNNEIKPTDEPGRVVLKARRLRAEGKIDEAAAAFMRFGEMFSKEYPWSKEYGRIARDYTLAFQKHPTDGIYLFDIKPIKDDQSILLKVGDIILKCNGQPVRCTDDYSEIAKAAGEKPIVMEILRKNQTGKFEKMEIEYTRGTCMLGLGGI